MAKCCQKASERSTKRVRCPCAVGLHSIPCFSSFPLQRPPLLQKRCAKRHGEGAKRSASRHTETSLEIGGEDTLAAHPLQSQDVRNSIAAMRTMRDRRRSESRNRPQTTLSFPSCFLCFFSFCRVGGQKVYGLPSKQHAGKKSSKSAQRNIA